MTTSRGDAGFQDYLDFFAATIEPQIEEFLRMAPFFPDLDPEDVESEHQALLDTALAEYRFIEMARWLKDKRLRRRDDAIPPPEVVHFAGSLEKALGWGWRSVPKLGHLGVGSLRMARRRVVDLAGPLSQLRDSPESCAMLQGAVGHQDVLNGCSLQCDTCYRDAPQPDKMASAESVVQLLHQPWFAGWLSPHGLTSGAAGDISNHPRALEIVQETLRVRKNSWPKGSALTLITSYRKFNEPLLRQLFDVARSDPHLKVLVSLPGQRTSTLQRQWERFREALNFHWWYQRPSNIDINGMDGLDDYIGLVHVGRVRNMCPTQARTPGFGDRGKVKLLLNPDGLWAAVATTRHQSHTGLAYTLVTPENLPVLRRLGWSGDRVPGGWPSRHDRKLSVATRITAARIHEALAKRFDTEHPPIHCSTKVVRIPSRQERRRRRVP